MSHSAHIAKVRTARVATYRSISAILGREKSDLLTEILQVKGLMPLLMKARNAQAWTDQDKRELRIQLHRLSSAKPYLAILRLPGSFVVLPALAQWLDRRRKIRMRQPYPACKLQLNEKPTKSILDRSFKYTPSTKTDLRKTFAKLRREQRMDRNALRVKNKLVSR